MRRGCCSSVTVLSPAEAKKNLIQKRKREKLPVDITPSVEEAPLDRTKEAVAVVTDTADPEADMRPPLSSSAGVSEAEPRPAKCVKISENEASVIPNPRYVLLGSLALALTPTLQRRQGSLHDCT